MRLSLGLAAALAAACVSSAAPVALDPASEGPFVTASIDDMTTSATGDVVPIHAVYPTGAGVPFPIVVLGHGFQIPVSQYAGYLSHLASFGYVVLTADYPDPLTGTATNDNDGKDLAAGLDWALGNATVKGLVDISRAGVMGHSRGGKAAAQAAFNDARFKAVYGIDPVDVPPLGQVPCDPSVCTPSYDELSTLSIPTLFVGELLDSMGGLACAPAAGNFAVFYAHAKSPSIEVTVNGASHMSFVDDPAACGVVCQVCTMPTVHQATVLGLAEAYSVAFFERYLRGRTEYDAYLTGAQAAQRYFTPGLATVASK